MLHTEKVFACFAAFSKPATVVAISEHPNLEVTNDASSNKTCTAKVSIGFKLPR